jgi:hypothetical protein
VDYTEFWEDYANCADIANGKYDKLMIDFAVQIMADRKPTSPPFYIRTLHEQVLPDVMCAYAYILSPLLYAYIHC